MYFQMSLLEKIYIHSKLTHFIKYISRPPLVAILVCSVETDWMLKRVLSTVLNLAYVCCRLLGHIEIGWWLIGTYPQNTSDKMALNEISEKPFWRTKRKHVCNKMSLKLKITIKPCKKRGHRCDVVAIYQPHGDVMVVWFKSSPQNCPERFADRTTAPTAPHMISQFCLAS